MLIGIFSDAHGDAEAISQALQALKPAEKLFFLGDVHEFVPEVKECIDLMQTHKVIAVRGNGDHHAVVGDKAGSYRKWLTNLPKEHHEGDMVFVHKPKDPHDVFGRKNFKVCFCGHTHRSFIISPLGQERLVPGCAIELNTELQYIIGIGSISRPREGEAKVVAIFDTEKLVLQIIKL